MRRERVRDEESRRDGGKVFQISARSLAHFLCRCMLKVHFYIQLNKHAMSNAHVRTHPALNLLFRFNMQLIAFDGGISHSLPFYVFCLELAPVPEKAPPLHHPPALLSEREREECERSTVCVRMRG